MIYRYILTSVFVALFVVVCSAQDKPEEKLSAKKAAQDFLNAQEKAEKKGASVIDKIDANTMMAVVGETLASQSLKQLESQVTEVEKLAEKSKVEKEFKAIIKFDFVYDKKDKLKDIADSAATLKELYPGVKKIVEGINNKIEETQKLIALETHNEKKLEEIEKKYHDFVRDLGQYAKAKLSGNDDEAKILRNNLDQLIETFTSKKVGKLGSVLLDEQEAKYLKQALDILGTRQDSNIDEAIKALLSELQKEPDSVKKWEEITHCRLIKSIVIHEKQYGELKKTVLLPLKEALEKPECKKIEKNLIFLYYYYDGLIRQRCNELSEAEEAFKKAEENAVSEQDKIKTQSKLLELQIQLATLAAK